MSSTESVDAHPCRDEQRDLVLEMRDVEMHFARRSALTRRTVGHVRAVDGVNLALSRSETIGVVGESGSGKSTLGRLALGLLNPTAGRVLVAGTDLSTLRGEARLKMRRRVQFVFQDPYSSLDPFATVGDSIAEPLRAHGLGTKAAHRETVAELLGQVGLDIGAAHRYPPSFSGGQLQRIAIARALALGPELIVLDEPVSSLDVSTQAEVVNLLGDLQRDTGVAFVFIGHDLAVVDHLSSRIAVMYLGKIVESGPTRSVVDAPKHPYTLALLSAVPRAELSESRRERIVLRGDLPSSTLEIAGCSFQTRCPFAMDVCRSVPPPPVTADDDSTSWCHLHTEGPALGGRTLLGLEVPSGQ